MHSGIYIEDNTVFVIERIIRTLNLKITRGTIKDLLLSHPKYPTLKCVTDSLLNLGIVHYALQLDHEEIKSIGVPFIAHLQISNGQLAFIEKIENEKVTYLV